VLGTGGRKDKRRPRGGSLISGKKIGCYHLKPKEFSEKTEKPRKTKKKRIVQMSDWRSSGQEVLSSNGGTLKKEISTKTDLRPEREARDRSPKMGGNAEGIPSSRKAEETIKRRQKSGDLGCGVRLEKRTNFDRKATV